MRILELDILSMEKLRKYTEPNKEKIDFGLFGDDFWSSVTSSCNKVDELVVILTANSISVLKIKQGKYYDYFSGAEVLFNDNQITRICLIVNYTNRDIDAKTFLPLPMSDLINSASEYVDRLIN